VSHLALIPSDESTRVFSKEPSALIGELKSLIREKVGSEKVLAALSGGVDSTVATLIAISALGERVTPVLLDTGFLRENEPQIVKKLFDSISPIPLKILERSEIFFKAVSALDDAESKRIAFRETFYAQLKEEAQKIGARWLLQGTIAPDWIETTGGIKTQHNVLAQLGIRTEERYGFSLLEPLAYLYKDQVRALARALGLPKEFANRQPFPGPGLLIRIPGRVSQEKLELVKKVNTIVEERLSTLSASQYFGAIFDAPERLATRVLKGYENYEFKERVTGVMGDARVYAKMLGVDAPERESLLKHYQKLVAELTSLKSEYTRVCVLISSKNEGKYAIVVRAVKTSDFMTADVALPPFELLVSLCSHVLKQAIREIYFDVTPKPPATIEYE
jgi:GMP synthase, PP-ATPase domain/subunit